MAAPEKVFEVNKDMDLTSIMQLVDLNGTMVNFQSDFTITSPGEISVAIVTQHQLDNGEIQFEKVSGSYSRRITYQENVHQNHFLGLKSNPPTTCHITIRLKELPQTVVRRKTHENVETDERRVRFQDDVTRPDIQRNTRQDAPRDTRLDSSRDMGRDMRDTPRDMGRDMRDTPRDMGRDMRDTPRDMGRDMRDTPRDMGRDMRDTPRDMGRDMRDTPRDMNRDRETHRDMGRDRDANRDRTDSVRVPMPTTLDPSVKQELHDQLQELYQQEDYVDNPTPTPADDKIPPPKHHNPYYFVGIICITLFVLLMSYKFFLKK